MLNRLLIAGLLPITCGASSLTAFSRVCLLFIQNCTDGPQGPAGGVFTGATGVGSATQNVGSNGSGEIWGMTAGATVDYGIFRGEATAGLSGFLVSPGDFVSGRAEGTQIETWTIHDPTGAHPAGSPGLYQVSYTVSGTSAVAGGPDADVDAFFTFAIIMNGPVFFGTQGSGEIHSSGVYSLAPLKFQYDVPTSVMIQYVVGASVQMISPSPNFDAHAGGSFQHTATLTGIQALDFFTGAPVFGTVLTSDSGTIYPLAVTAVPEPATFLLAGAGLIACGLRRRRAR
jgi:hypothetical protein